MATYAVSVSVPASAAQDLLRITPPVGKTLKLIECHATNEGTAVSEMLTFSISLASTNGAGTEVLLVALDPGDASFAGSAAYALSSIATKDAVLNREAASAQSGYHYVPLKPSRPVISDDQRFVLRLEDSPASAKTFAVTAVVKTDG